jgi:hypothetical protein
MAFNFGNKNDNLKSDLNRRQWDLDSKNYPLDFDYPGEEVFN